VKDRQARIAMDLDDIKRLIDLVAGSRLTVLDVTIGDARVRIEAAGSTEVPTSSVPVGPAAIEPGRARMPENAGAAPTASTALTVRAPTDGIVHLRPTPDARPFVVEGQSVEATDTVFLIEVMKAFHAVPAGQAGTVCAIRVRDGQHVAFDEVVLELA
jgi:acetyl-CoA carboxylase biotin carboxyl carrier protein